MTDEQMRQAFEAFLHTSGLSKKDMSQFLELDSVGEYRSRILIASFEAWKAATRLERERCAKVCEALQEKTGYELGPFSDCAAAIRQIGGVV
jgi:hypothetical protein